MNYLIIWDRTPFYFADAVHAGNFIAKLIAEWEPNRSLIAAYRIHYIPEKDWPAKE